MPRLFYIANSQDLKHQLIERGYTWTNSYYAGDKQFSKPGQSPLSLEQAIQREGLKPDLKPCFRDEDPNWNA